MNRFYIADTHFGHSNILSFKRNDGTPLRQFCCVSEMDEHMVKCWNSVVGPKDTVYHLGDVTMHHKNLPILDRLNGRKILIKGNHDTAKLSQYAKYFEDIRAYDRKPGIIASHVPIHTGSLERWGVNVHGHTHAHSLADPRYYCVSVEQIKYTPLEYTELLRRINANCETILLRSLDAEEPTDWTEASRIVQGLKPTSKSI